MKYKVNKEILKACRKVGHCVCDLGKPCPCDDFLDNNDCRCGAFKEVKE
jgi:hypothetical protein